MDLILKSNGFGGEEGLVWGGIVLELDAASRGIEGLCAWCFPSKGGKIVSAVAEFC